ncbi:MAG: helix-turn-helix domain-containing protein [Actinomycetota bacterium]
MASELLPTHPRTSRADARVSAILAAAIEEFSQRGYAGTSMANIAAAADVSRPALYQYFRDKDHIFASAFVALFAEHVDRALDALVSSERTADGLDGLLQRFDGDLWERMAASPHIDELIGRKEATLAAAVGEEVDRLWVGLAAHLRRRVPGRSRAVVDQRDAWIELLRMAPQGFRVDEPSVDVYRGRLNALARSVAADIDAAGPDGS